MLQAVIMAGGAGTRFWPLSRAATPKQLLRLAGERTMMQATVDRLAGLVPAEQLLIVTNRALVVPIRSQLPQLGNKQVLGEPCKRDTAPCIGLAAVLLSHVDADATMVVMPADHLIEPTDRFQGAIRQGVSLVDEQPDRIVTFGIKPTFPAETFGYIERGQPLPASKGTASAFQVARFREKPARRVAEEYLAAGNFYWNSGIFIWKAKAILAALAEYEPDMHSSLMTIAAEVGRPGFDERLDREFSAIRPKSIDFAVLERYPNVAVIEAPFHWDDVGSWQALARSQPLDESGNALSGRTLPIRTAGSIVRSSDDHLVVTLGLQDTIVVHTPDATLVANKHDEEAIREVVKALQDRGLNEYL
jgi:mannose-1-phosphate guanylyltransferase